MNALEYTFVAYAAGLGLMLGYAVMLWLESRVLARRQRARGGRS